jgi:hypothetical protein
VFHPKFCDAKEIKVKYDDLVHETMFCGLTHPACSVQPETLTTIQRQTARRFRHEVQLCVSAERREERAKYRGGNV